MTKRVVIVGGVACGAKTASRLMRVCADADVTMIEKGDWVSYAGCGLPYYVGGIVSEYRQLAGTALGVMRDAAYFRNVKHVEVLTRHIATRIDRGNRTVHVTDMNTGEEKRFPYDVLVLATGASPIRPPLPGVDLGRVYTLWTMPDALAMREAVDSGTVKDAVIVGAGLVGMEMVESLVNKGIRVSVVDALPEPLPAVFDGEFGLRLRKCMERHGVAFYGGEKLLEIAGEGGTAKAVRTDARTIPCDMALLSVGVRPNTALAGDAGLELGSRGAIVVDSHMRTSDPDIYAGGDCVETVNALTGKRVWQPMGSTANRQGRVIADAIAGLPSTFRGVQGTGILRFFELTAGKTGLSDAEARDAGFDPVGVTVVGGDIPHFMPGAGSLTMRLSCDRTSRRVLGLQAIGNGKADKRLDAAVTAIAGGMTVDDLADADLAYAPPFSTALDMLTHAANALRNKLDGLMPSYSATELAAKFERGENPLLLDVRTAPELDAQGRLPYDFVHIPLGQLWGRAEELPKDREIVTFCKVSIRGWDALCILRRLGFSRVAALEGGVMGWPYSLR